MLYHEILNKKCSQVFFFLNESFVSKRCDRNVKTKHFSKKNIINNCARLPHKLINKTKN